MHEGYRKAPRTKTPPGALPSPAKSGRRKALQRQRSEHRDGGHHAADFGKAAQSADRRIAGMGGLAHIVEELMPVVGPEGDAPGRIAAIAPALLLLEQHGDDR